MLRRILLIISGLVFAFILSQFLEFKQQYTQRASGALDELNHQITALDQRAESVDKSRLHYILGFLENENQESHMEGLHMVEQLGRHMRLTKTLNKIKFAPQYQQIFTLIAHADLPSIKATFNDYKPALPMSITGAIYTVSGFIFGYILMMILMMFFPKKIHRQSY